MLDPDTIYTGVYYHSILECSYSVLHFLILSAFSPPRRKEPSSHSEESPKPTVSPSDVGELEKEMEEADKKETKEPPKTPKTPKELETVGGEEVEEALTKSEESNDLHDH